MRETGSSTQVTTVLHNLATNVGIGEIGSVQGLSDSTPRIRDHVPRVTSVMCEPRVDLVLAIRCSERGECIFLLHESCCCGCRAPTAEPVNELGLWCVFRVSGSLRSDSSASAGGDGRINSRQ